jgi:indolepyruvate ferredoxin oxidoreductase alpha subunit
MKGINVLATALKRAADCFYAVPGYPVTAVAEEVRAEPVINEKVGLEYALGDSISGRRAAVIIKNVGLNACTDPLVHATTVGLAAGVVVVAGDDLEVRASENAQDSRYFGELAQIPVLEPDGMALGQAVEEAFAASERFSRIALLRITDPLLEGEADPVYATRGNTRGHLADPFLTMKGRVQAAEQVFADMFAWSRRSPLNRLGKGVAAAGAAEGDSRVVTVYPPPAGPENLEEVRELGRPFLHDHRCTGMAGVTGTPETMKDRGYYRTFCRDCPYRPLLSLLKERDLSVVCDTGCALLAQNPPYGIGVGGYGLGSSIAVAARSTRIALCGDFSLLHSGMNALIDVYEKGTGLLCIVLNNRRMGMTGGQVAPDIHPYIRWAHPVVLDAGDVNAIAEYLSVPDTPRTLVIEGCCPEGEEHETVEC